MKSAMRRTISGPFSARSLGAGALQLTTDALPGLAIYLWGAGPEARELLKDARFTALDIEWRANDVKLSFTGANGARLLTAKSAIVHEPQPHLYEGLPLATFDADARRFWTRVFLLTRIPGGRWLLRFIARRNRGGTRGAA